MKLIIDIPEEAKQVFDKAEYNYLKGGYYDCGGIIGKAIQNGIPLDDVKAEIRAEQEKYSHPLEIERAIEILDNIGKAESEDT